MGFESIKWDDDFEMYTLLHRDVSFHAYAHHFNVLSSAS